MKKLLAVSILLLLPLSFACSGAKKSSEKSEGPVVPLTAGLAQSTEGNVVAKLNGQPITEEELLVIIKPRISRIENQLYDIKRDGVDQIIEEKLLDVEAKKRNTTIQELLKKEVYDKVGEVTDKEIEDFYNENKARVGGRSLEELKPAISAQIKSRKAGVYHDTLMDRLMAKADVQIYIERPRVEVGVGNSPSKGPANAPVTIIEFTDYQCPFCAKARPATSQIMDTYKNNVRYVVRNFPLDFHNFAKKAAEAALCANEQKKYWEYSKKLWENQNTLDVESLKKYASELKLDTQKFNDCLDTDKTLAEVLKDQQEGAKAGVTGTPAFFINGQILTGAQPFDAFKKVIDQELKDAKRKKS